ncbi:hypothetical protein ACFVRR_22970 [Gottfriedia sp. NPDC057948]|uniref:hypothetical protein n=1 Tax=Gottfriedia sp. NPDC057948 TaxID=3346287 RepID=UPI0036DD539A
MTRYINLRDTKKEFKKDFYPKVEKGIGQKGLADFNGKTEELLFFVAKQNTELQII